MIKVLVLKNTGVIIFIIISVFLCIKLLMLNKVPTRDKFALFIKSLGFRSLSQLRNVNSKRKQIFFRRSNVLNLAVYIIISVILSVYLLLHTF